MEVVEVQRPAPEHLCGVIYGVFGAGFQLGLYSILRSQLQLAYAVEGGYSLQKRKTDASASQKRVSCNPNSV